MITHFLTDGENALALEVARLRYEKAKNDGAKPRYSAGLNMLQMNQVGVKGEIAFEAEYPLFTRKTALFEEDRKRFLGSTDYTYLGKTWELKTHRLKTRRFDTMLENVGTFNAKTRFSDFLMSSAMVCPQYLIEKERRVDIHGCLRTKQLIGREIVKNEKDPTRDAYRYSLKELMEIPR